MAKVTAIEPQKKNPLRENIFLDNVFAFGISAELRFLSKIHAGDNLIPSQVKKLIQKDQIARLVEKSLNFLSYRPRSEKELKDHLLFKGKLTEIESEFEKKEYKRNIDEAVNFLKKHKQIDDKQFAIWWVESRRKFKKAGDHIIKQELSIKGIDKELANELLTEMESDPYELAMEATKKKLVSYQKLARREFKIKMGQYLMRKGFSWETISRVVDTLSKKD